MRDETDDGVKRGCFFGIGFVFLDGEGKSEERAEKCNKLIV